MIRDFTENPLIVKIVPGSVTRHRETLPIKPNPYMESTMKARPSTACRILLLVMLCISLPLPATAAVALNVFVSILPQKYFVQKIGGDLVSVSVMVPPGFSPATYEPRPGQMVRLAKAKVYFAVGVAFEGVWLRKFAGTNPEMMIVDTGKWIEKMPMEMHPHGGDRNHHSMKRIGPGMRDPHIWLSPPLVILQARHILNALVKVDPLNRDRYRDGYRSFVRELVDLDLGISQILKGAGGRRRFMVYHPAWGYFARTYNLVQIPVEEEGKEPTPKGLQQLIRTARDLGLKIVLVQPQFSTKSANTIAKAMGGRVVFADPLAVDWKENMLSVAREIGQALK